MSGIKINAGEIALLVNDDPDRVIRFNPEDILFAERFYGLIKDFEEVQETYEKKLKSILPEGDVPEGEIPENTEELFQTVHEVCDFLLLKIDEVFGAGTSEAAFQGVKSLSQIEQFFEGITPFVQTKRQEKVNKYVRKRK